MSAVSKSRAEQAVRRQNPDYMAWHSYSGTGECLFTSMNMQQINMLEDVFAYFDGHTWLKPVWLEVLTATVLNSPATISQG